MEAVDSTQGCYLGSTAGGYTSSGAAVGLGTLAALGPATSLAPEAPGALEAPEAREASCTQPSVLKDAWWALEAGILVATEPGVYQ